MWHRPLKTVPDLFPSRPNGGNLCLERQRRKEQIMKTKILALGIVAVLAGCASPVPDSNPNSGVGFSNYDAFATERARRDAELQAMQPRPIPDGQAIASETLTVLATPRTIGGTAPVTGVGGSTATGQLGTAPAPAPQPVQQEVIVAAAPAVVETEPLEAELAPNNPDISDEQDFDAVASRESIESDAERIERNRETYQVVEPTAVPERGSNKRPNVVAFALATSHPLGTQVYRRTGSADVSRFNRECARYPSADRAQEAFLANGGPQRDRRGMDPDGDGYACFWDPTPFRSARGG